MPTYVKISDIPISRAALATDKMEVQATGAGASAQVTAQSVADLYVPSTTLTGGVTGSGSGSILTVVASVPAAAMPALTGDVTTVAGAVATTLATVNSNVGSFTHSSITVNAKGLITAASSGAAAIYTVSAFFPGLPTASAIVVRVPVSAAVAIAANFAGSYGVASAAATASTAYDITKNGSTIGTATFALGATTATFTSAGGSTQSLVAGDIIAIVAPASPDATLANPGFALAGTR